MFMFDVEVFFQQIENLFHVHSVLAHCIDFHFLDHVNSLKIVKSRGIAVRRSSLMNDRRCDIKYPFTRTIFSSMLSKNHERGSMRCPIAHEYTACAAYFLPANLSFVLHALARNQFLSSTRRVINRY